MADTLQERLRLNPAISRGERYMDLREEAADALDAKDAEIAELRANVAGLEGRIAGMRDAAWNEAIAAAAKVADLWATDVQRQHGHGGPAAHIRSLKREDTP